jgi:hypothetical protein
MPSPLRSLAVLAFCAAAGRAADPAVVAFAPTPGGLAVTVGGRPAMTYVLQDKAITRPYFAHLEAPGGVPVSRTHPPVAGRDPTDHATFHPGLWLAFGDLNGADGWRNKAPVRHEKFVADPTGGPGAGRFAVANVHLAADGTTAVAREEARYEVRVRPVGTLLIWDSTLRPAAGRLLFGDQEEMGLGVRLSTPLTVKNGGRFTSPDGAGAEKDVRGRQLDWCDYSGTVGAGVTLVPDPKNPRRCWFHARDYGLLVANPFAPKALGGGKPDPMVIEPGGALRLRFGVLLHAGPAFDAKAAAADVLAQLAAVP